MELIKWNIIKGSGMLATQGLYSIIGAAFLGVVVVWVGVQYTVLPHARSPASFKAWASACGPPTLR